MNGPAQLALGSSDAATRNSNNRIKGKNTIHKKRSTTEYQPDETSFTGRHLLYGKKEEDPTEKFTPRLYIENRDKGTKLRIPTLNKKTNSKPTT